MNTGRIPPGQETAETYHRSGAWGSTLIGLFRDSPRLAHLVRTGSWKRPETASLLLGRRFHALMEDPDAFARTHLPGPDVHRNTKAWKEADAAATAAGQTLLTIEEERILRAMRTSVLANPIAADLIAGAEREVGFRRDSPFGPYQVQCRADLLADGRYLADYKTIDRLDHLDTSIARYGYYRQAAFYRWLVHEVTGWWLPFHLIVVETAAPLYRCRVVDLDDAYLALGWTEAKDALIQIGDRSRRGDWEDHDHACSLHPPRWLVSTAMLTPETETAVEEAA